MKPVINRPPCSRPQLLTSVKDWYVIICYESGLWASWVPGLSKIPFVLPVLAHNVEWTHRWVIRVAHPSVFTDLPLFQHIQGGGSKHQQSPKRCVSRVPRTVKVLLTPSVAWSVKDGRGSYLRMCQNPMTSHRDLSHVLSFLQNPWPSLYEQGLFFSCAGVVLKLPPGIGCHGKVRWSFSGRSLKKKNANRYATVMDFSTHRV